MKVLIATGSVRKGRVSDSLQQLVTKDLQARDVEVTVADFREIQLPFFDNEHTPDSEGYEVNSEAGKLWSKLVKEADAVVLLTPEYNHSMTAVQKNAIDTLYAEWNGKPVVAIPYGWYAGEHAMVTLRTVLGRLKADLKPVVGGLTFKKDIDVDGSLLDEEAATKTIHEALDQIVS